MAVAAEAEAAALDSSASWEGQHINTRCCSLTRSCIGRSADSGARCRVFQKCDDARSSGRNEALRSATMRSERQQAPGELTAAQTAGLTTQHASVVAVAQPAAINAAATEVLTQRTACCYVAPRIEQHSGSAASELMTTEAH